MWFRYQEFDEGIHNFDDEHIFTTALLRFMREYMKVNGATTFAASPRPIYSQPAPRLYPVVNYPGTRDVYRHIPPLCYRLQQEVTIDINESRSGNGVPWSWVMSMNFALFILTQN